MVHKLLLLLAIFSLSACSSFDFFESDDVDEENLEPAELVKFDETIELNKMWSTGIGDGLGGKYDRLAPTIIGDRVFAADVEGVVVALDRADGDEIWSVELEQIITGGVGSYGEQIFIGSESGEIIALSQSSGEVLWRAQLSSEILSSPVSNGDVVVAQTSDGSLVGVDYSSGAQRWVYESVRPVFSLRGTGTPVITPNVAIAGFANGKMVAVSADQGVTQWEHRIGVPKGRSEIERMVDIDGQVILRGNVAFGASYQGNITAVDVTSGRAIWQRPMSSYSGVDGGLGNIYVSNDQSHVVALDQRNAEVLWEQTDLTRRSITAPVVVKDYIAVGDFEGYLHLLNQRDGGFAARVKVDGDGVRANPIVGPDDVLYVQSNGGKLVAYSLD